jgi:hypothetical protein
MVTWGMGLAVGILRRVPGILEDVGVPEDSAWSMTALYGVMSRQERRLLFPGGNIMPRFTLPWPSQLQHNRGAGFI